jgi:hypothetical protein
MKGNPAWDERPGTRKSNQLVLILQVSEVWIVRCRPEVQKRASDPEKSLLIIPAYRIRTMTYIDVGTTPGPLPRGAR